MSQFKEQNDLLFADEPVQGMESVETVETCWKLLVVDDDADVHAVTTLVLKGFKFQGQPLEVFNAHSAAQAQVVLTQHPDIHLALIDVVMETESAGLQLVEHIRTRLGHSMMRLLLRTGQPGQAPENRVIQEYDINGYLEKAELSAQKLISAVTTGLRSYAELETQQQQMQDLREQAEAGDKAKRAFVANISHEIRTPLNAIQGFAQTLLDSNGSSQQQAALSIILESSQHLTHLVEDLLLLAQFETDDIQLRCDSFHLPDFLREIADFSQRLADQAAVQMHCDIMQPMPKHIHSDMVILRQVLLRLLNNAIKFATSAQTAGQVLLKVRYADEKVHFHIEDNGPGMSSSEKQHMLGAFQQGETRGAKNDGLGLGLTLSQRYLQLLHTELNMDCVEQQGCCFHFSLPLPKATEWVQGALPVAEPEQKRCASKAFAPKGLPPAPSVEKLQNLYELALQGYIQDIADEAERLHEWDARFHQFAEDLRLLSENFQKSELCKYLKAYLDA